MGRKKSFIDKKTSTTYSLIYRSQDEVNDDPDKVERVLLPADKVGVPDPEKAASSGGRWPAGHPLAWMEAEQNNKVGEDSRRREIVSLGLPDDGYDYLKHMRLVGGQGSASLVEVPEEKPKKYDSDTVSLVEEVAGPSVFVPATKGTKSKAVRDEKMLDASKLVVRSKADDDDGAEQLASGITAFSREVKAVQGPGKEEISEVAAALAALEEDEDEGHFDTEALDDEFILQATEWDAQKGEDQEASDDDDEEGEEFSSGVESGDEEEDDDDEEDGIRGYPGYRGDGASLASSYWRKERSDRNDNLTMIDERFERLAFQYDEDQIGELDDEADEGELAGISDIAHFDGILDEFIEKNKSLMPGGSGDPDKDEEAAARQLAKGFVREDGDDEDAGDPIALLYPDKPKEQWDCESVLSLRSNLDNHPGRIEEPRRNRKAKAGANGKIKLSSKTGLPVLVEGGQDDNSEGSDSDDESVGFSVASTLRKKDESAEEKKARKAAVKDAQRHARERKKELKTMFKEEKSKIKKLTTTHRTMPLA